MNSLQNFIAGQFLHSQHSATCDVFNPATGQIIAQCPQGQTQDIEQAVTAAEHAFASWSALKPSERARWLSKLADAIEQHSEAFVRCEMRNTGKPIRTVREFEIPRAIENFRFFAAAGMQSIDQAYHGEAGLNYSQHVPLGSVGIISPWNLPLYLLTWKMAPALAAGNCVIAKPSEITPMSADLLAQIIQSIQFPAGVINIVHGLGDTVGAALVQHPKIRAISFTGSTRVGKTIAIECAKQLKKLTLEMGGKNPAIIFPDAPMETLKAYLTRIGFQNSGQICLCGSRILIHHTIYESVKTQLLEQLKALRMGDPEHQDTQLGPLMSHVHFNKVLGYIELAQQEGARILCGGHAIQPDEKTALGWFIAPTVIEGLPMQSRVCQEEIFGPVISLHPFETDAEAIALANDSNYGLAASVWTADISRAQHIAQALDTGIVWINTWLQRDLRTPFGGMKQSGYGREGGLDALKFFSEPKTVCIGNSYD